MAHNQELLSQFEAQALWLLCVHAFEQILQPIATLGPNKVAIRRETSMLRRAD